MFWWEDLLQNLIMFFYTKTKQTNEIKLNCNNFEKRDVLLAKEKKTERLKPGDDKKKQEKSFTVEKKKQTNLYRHFCGCFKPIYLM